MHRAHPGALAIEPAADVQQTRGVPGGADLGAGRDTAWILSLSIAAEVSAFLTENVPPKPQHSPLSGSSTSSIPRTFRSSRSGASPSFSSAGHGSSGDR